MQAKGSQQTTRRWWALAWLALALGLIAGGVWLRTQYAPFETVGPAFIREGSQETALRVFQVEADCYTRLYRVKNTLETGTLIHSFHPWENYPDGMVPTTTLPLDLAILAIYFASSPFFHFALDWAGGLVSPVLFVIAGCYVVAWGWRRDTLAWLLLLALLSTIPALSWAGHFARPDHQSLILLCLLVGWTCEFWRWEDDAPLGPRTWAILGGLAWGLALWTSLFEPLILLVLFLLGNLALRQREQWPFLAALGGMVLLAWLVEGFHVSAPPPEYRDYLARWLTTIGEMKPMEWFVVLLRAAPIAVFPLVVARCLFLSGELKPHELLTFGITLVLIALPFLMTRWVPYAALASALCAYVWAQREPLAWVKWCGTVLVLAATLFTAEGLRSFAAQNRLNPTGGAIVNSAISRTGLEFALSIQSEPGGILAPEYLSPYLLYYSGQPIVASSSHVTIPGIVDACRVFTATDFRVVDEILQRRKVRWVVIHHPAIAREISMRILDIQEDPEKPRMRFVDQMFNLRAVPTRFRLVAVNDQFMLFRYTPPK